MSYCFVIPNFNHTEYLQPLLQELRKYQLPVIMVNDGSDEDASNYFRQLESEYTFLTLVHHQQNQGKGGAVQSGLKRAHQDGYDYAIQIDSDGQHCLDDIEMMLALSKQNPQSVISGMPVYDDSIPRHRYWARYITHFWVMIETLSLQLKDTMCGFRVYPLQPCIELMQATTLGKRMDFDIEILVRLYWRDVPIKFFPTQVIYPENGVSHFKAFKDNVLISWMHTRLVFGMLMRSPLLIKKSLS
ncbi:glycosyltransferase family 2 protein [Thalassotalea litorea]|uniref:glycosyltransferase family 2 protein n=1 Tax=Thalassotalea litorea TaxID=2020715 RepID=UPI003734FC64